MVGRYFRSNSFWVFKVWGGWLVLIKHISHIICFCSMNRWMKQFRIRILVCIPNLLIYLDVSRNICRCNWSSQQPSRMPFTLLPRVLWSRFYTSKQMWNLTFNTGSLIVGFILFRVEQKLEFFILQGVPLFQHFFMSEMRTKSWNT